MAQIVTGTGWSSVNRFLGFRVNVASGYSL